MRIKQFAAAALLSVSALSLAGCASGLPTQVSRVQAMPAPQGQSFFITASHPADTGGPEFDRYAGQVAQALQAKGYAQAPSLEAATMVVGLDYGVDEGQDQVERDPFARGYGYDPFWGGGYGAYGPYGLYGRPYYSRWGYYGARSPFYYGWNDPYWYSRGFGGPNSQLRVYTEYKSFLDLAIRRKADNAPLFEGHAKARSANDDLGVLVPNLIEAMFTGFPGQSGETIKITVPPAKKPG